MYNKKTLLKMGKDLEQVLDQRQTDGKQAYEKMIDVIQY